MSQPPLLTRTYGGYEIGEYLDSLRERGFDIRQRYYETEENYHRRIVVSARAFDLSYEEPMWSSLRKWVQICPSGLSSRLPRDKEELPPHECFYLEIKHVHPENWLVVSDLTLRPAQKLPRRATYIASEGDVFLSRFKEPLGKSVIYFGDPDPLYVNSNYFLLRPKPDVSPLLVIALLKSSFLACQLHQLIKQRAVIKEMFQNEVPEIMFPNLPVSLEDQIIEQAENRLTAEKDYRIASDVTREYWDRADERRAAVQVMNETDKIVDGVILSFCENSR